MKIFMIGTQRSGSNLLRLMLNQAPAIAAPHPPHILERFAPLLPLYGSLADDAAFDCLVDDVLRLVEANPVPWPVAFDRSDIRRRCHERSLVAVFGAVMDRMAEAGAKPDWVCKSLANVHFLPEIERCFGADARYLYLYRDGRDVCLSFMKAVVGEKTAYHVARQWHAEQQLALACGQRVPAAQYLALSYEELTQAPEPALRRLCAWLGTEFHPAMLDFHASDEAGRTASSGKMWENVRKPVMAGNSRKWLEGLSQDQIIDFESVAGESLAALGYELEFVGKSCEARRYDAQAVAALDAENRRLKGVARQELSPADAAARKPQEDLLAEIRSRAVTA
ncbi:sulfotransferase family protein [Rubrivivax gelatinosus]|uniref:Sulfotransferase n=1 Tax=Rubrivivax gelatinosus TaxID=28068 RepID=A0ABS1DYV1_RUBGE|nr:sulfotransferase [Rubrivivax gelatinosus]MBK1714559.1 sulfotransferase [Rubrivivax gelatinosus]